MAEDEHIQDAKLVLAQKIFQLRSIGRHGAEKDEIESEIKSIVDKERCVQLVRLLSQEFGWSLDEALLTATEVSNDEELRKIDEKIEDAQENLGESEVREAHLAKSLFYVRIGEKDKALAQLDLTESKTVAVGLKMDLVFHTLRLAFFHLDFPLIQSNIDKAKSLFDQGGDWERKNRLKVYQGLFFMSIRKFKKAADLFLEAISTFGAYELFSYRDFVFYTVLCSVVSLDRVTLKSKVVDTPEILAVIEQVPHLFDFLNSLYGCQYKTFFIALAGISDLIKKDRYLNPHYRHLLREIRVVAYSQYLESYKSVTLEAMSKAFGVSVDFLDGELSVLIAAGRLNCRIDKVSGVLETNRPDSKNALYQQVVKQGDLLLNRIQRLSKVIDV